MGVALVRIDDRLVHGQVVEGWLRVLRVNHVVVASDNVASDETQMALYSLAVPYGVQLSCLHIREAAHAWKNGDWEKEKVLVLVSSPADVLRLVEEGAPVHSVNVGGLYFREGRVQILKAVSLDDEDVHVLKKLAGQGIVLEARPLPLDEPINVAPYLERWQQDREALGDQPR